MTAHRDQEQADQAPPDERALCAMLRSAAEAQMAYVQIFLDRSGAAPLRLGEALEDIANGYLNLSEIVVRMRLSETLRSDGNLGRQ